MTVRIERQTHLHATPAELWPIVSDTDRTNRLLGQGEVRYKPNGPESLARFTAETKGAFGIVLRYEELPFEWEAPHRMRVVRRMQSSPLREYSFAVSLREDGQGSQVHFELNLEPRYAWARPLAWLVGRGIAINYLRFLAKADRFLGQAAAENAATGARAGGPAPLDHPFAEPRSPTDQDELVRRTKTLGRLLREGAEPPAESGLAERLAELLRDASDVDVAKIRPFELADAWGAGRRDVLSACLHGVRAGLVELRFAVVCPSCLVPSDTVAQLSDIGDSGHCDQCDLRFDLDLDRAVEVIFRAHPAVRDLPDRIFCLGSPARSPHVLEQRHFANGETGTLTAPVRQGRYRLFLRGGLTAAIEVRADAAEEGAATPVPRLVFDDQQVAPAFLAVAPGARVEVENRGSSARHGKLEILEYATAAATVHQVSVIPEFRRLCSKELLKAGTPLKVANVVLLFSDLTGSTALYSEIGDAAAFRVVDDHFDVLRAAIEEEGGTIIKTMGDAVMASFLDVRGAIRATARCMDGFSRWQKTVPLGDHIGLKLGLHSGSCYVITANGMLDYFGQTVNVAARLQGLAASGECTLTRELLDSVPGELLAGFSTDRSTPAARLKGVDAAVDVVHLTRRSSAT